MTERSIWIVIPTYNERDNIRPLVLAVNEANPDAHVLIVDDQSPDGTGEIADALAMEDPSISVLHRPGKQGLGAAYRHGMRVALSAGAQVLVQMDCDFSHDPRDVPAMLAALDRGDVVLGSRYVAGGRTENWGLLRKVVSRGGCLTAQIVLALPFKDLTGGFKVWRADLLERIAFEEAQASGYGFQIEMTWRAHRAGARIIEFPIVFRERRSGASKMSGRIVAEAVLVLVRLRLATLRRRSRPRGT